jgi:hypothetical protein
MSGIYGRIADFAASSMLFLAGLLQAWLAANDGSCSIKETNAAISKRCATVL